MELGQWQRAGPQQGAERHGRGVLQLPPARPWLEWILDKLLHRAAHALFQGTQQCGFSDTLIYQLEVYKIIQFRIQYKPETVEASKRRLGRMKLAFKVVKGAIAFAVLAFVINLIRWIMTWEIWEQYNEVTNRLIYTCWETSATGCICACIWICGSLWRWHIPRCMHWSRSLHLHRKQGHWLLGRCNPLPHRIRPCAIL